MTTTITLKTIKTKIDEKPLSHYQKYKETYKKYYEANKDKYNYENFHKKYYEENTEKIRERAKKYYYDNKEIIAPKLRLASQKYHAKNKDKAKARYEKQKLEKILCVTCGKEIGKLNYNKHLQTDIHKKFIDNNSILQFVLFEKSKPKTDSTCE